MERSNSKDKPAGVLTMPDMNKEQRDEFIRKWCAVQSGPVAFLNQGVQFIRNEDEDDVHQNINPTS